MFSSCFIESVLTCASVSWFEYITPKKIATGTVNHLVHRFCMPRCKIGRWKKSCVWSHSCLFNPLKLLLSPFSIFKVHCTHCGHFIILTQFSCLFFTNPFELILSYIWALKHGIITAVCRLFLKYIYPLHVAFYFWLDSSVFNQGRPPPHQSQYPSVGGFRVKITAHVHTKHFGNCQMTESNEHTSAHTNGRLSVKGIVNSSSQPWVSSTTRPKRQWLHWAYEQRQPVSLTKKSSAVGVQSMNCKEMLTGTFELLFWMMYG